MGVGMMRRAHRLADRKRSQEAKPEINVEQAIAALPPKARERITAALDKVFLDATEELRAAKVRIAELETALEAATAPTPTAPPDPEPLAETPPEQEQPAAPAETPAPEPMPEPAPEPTKPEAHRRRGK